MKNRFLTLAMFWTVLSVAPAAWAHGDEVHVLGTVRTLDTSSITVETKNGKATKILVDSNTKFEKSGEVATLEQLSVGERVVIHAVKKGVLTAATVKFGNVKAAHPKESEGYNHAFDSL